MNPTLSTLNGLRPDQAEALLCRAIDVFLPNVEDPPTGESEQRLIAEAREVVGKGDDDTAVARLLGDELAARLLPEEEVAPTRQRLIESGTLPLRDYRAVFGGSWKDQDSFMGVTRIEALYALGVATNEARIVNPAWHGAAQHRGGAVQAVGLAAAEIDGNGGRQLLLMVFALADGECRIGDAFRLFPDDVPASVRMPAPGLLARFLTKYGADFRFGHDPRYQKLLFNVQVDGDVRSMKLRHRDNDKQYHFVVAAIGPNWNQPARVFVAYAFNVDLYRRSMARRGIDFE